MKLIKVEKVERPDSRLRGLATIELDNGYIIKDLKIVKGERGLMISPPIIPKDYEEMNEHEKYLTEVLNDKVSKQKMINMILRDFMEL